MAQAALKDISKTEIAEAYGKLKIRDKKRRQAAKAETEALIEDLVVVGSGIGMGWLMGMRVADADLNITAEQAAAGDTAESRIKEKTQVAGIDLDLLVSLGAAGVGLTKYGGGMSGFARSVGIGGLTSWGSRKFFFKAIEDSEGEDKNNAFPSPAYGYFS